MKQLTYIFLLVCLGSLFTPLMAQLTKGQGFLGGNLSFYNNNYKNALNQKSSGNSTNIGVYGGHFFKDNVAYTLGASIGESKDVGFNYVYTPAGISASGEQLYTSQYVDTKRIYTNLGLSVGLSRFVPLSERFYVVLAASFGANFLNNESTDTPPGQAEQVSKSSQTNLSLNFNPGLVYFLSPRFGLNGSFGGFSLAYQPKSSYNASASFSGNFSTTGILGIGVSYFFRP